MILNQDYVQILQHRINHYILIPDPEVRFLFLYFPGGIYKNILSFDRMLYLSIYNVISVDFIQ